MRDTRSAFELFLVGIVSFLFGILAAPNKRSTVKSTPSLSDRDSVQPEPQNLSTATRPIPYSRPERVSSSLSPALPALDFSSFSNRLVLLANREVNATDSGSNFIYNIQSKEYLQLFGEAGLNTNLHQQMLQQLAEMTKLMYLAEASSIDVRQKQDSIIQALRTNLTPERYEEFKSQAMGWQLRDELKSFRSFISDTGYQLDSSSTQLLSDAIRSSEAYYNHSGIGLFDPVPRPTVGPEETAKQLEDRISKLRDAANSALSSLATRIPDELLDYVAQYYTDQVKVLSDQRAAFLILRDNPENVDAASERLAAAQNGKAIKKRP